MFLRGFSWGERDQTLWFNAYILSAPLNAITWARIFCFTKVFFYYLCNLSATMQLLANIWQYHNPQFYSVVDRWYAV